MKKILILIILSLLINSLTFSQSCLPDGIVFDSQNEINNFRSNHPNCTVIEGDVRIHGDIKNTAEKISYLDSLYVLTAIEGELILEFLSLENFSGLQNLEEIGGELMISDCEGPTDLTGFNNLTTISGSLSIIDSDYLENLNGMENLTAIDGDMNIGWNWRLKSLEGIDNIDPESIRDLYFNYNDSLSTCEVLSVCNYLDSINGDAFIRNNASGCDSIEEVQTNCEGVSINEIHSQHSITIFPNPANKRITIASGHNITISEIFIYNSMGKTVINKNHHADIIDVSNFNSGIYLIKIKTTDATYTEKIIIR